jgi:hypothetical protein
LRLCFGVTYNPSSSRFETTRNMTAYQQKTDSQEFAVASSGQPPSSEGGGPAADATDIAIRLWGSPGPGRGVPLTWKSGSVLVYMIADLVCASGGRVVEESSEIMAAHFAGSRQALVAAKRMQTSILEFLACRPEERVGGAVLIYQPRTSVATGFSGEMVRQSLGQAKPGQILLAEDISNRLRELPGIEVSPVPALATLSGDEQSGLTELVWMTPAQSALLQTSVGDDAESEGNDQPTMGATVIVDSPFARRGPIRETVPPVMGPVEVASSKGGEAGSRRASEVVSQDRASAFEELRNSPSRSFEEGLDEFEEKPLITRSRIILGVVALVLLSAVIAVLSRPTKVSRAPIPLQQDQTGPTEIPDKPPPAKAGAETTTTQPVSKTVKAEIAKPQMVKSPAGKPPIPKSGARVAATQPQVPDRVSEENRAKSVTLEEPPAYAESGGVSLKDIPVLIKMAQQDAGAGNYDKARTEYRKVLGLQPGNPDAKEGLHKLDLIQKDQQ